MEIKINGLVKCTKMPDRNGWKQLFGTKWEEATAHLKHSILITEEMVYVHFDMLPFLSPSSSNAYDCIHIGLWQCGVRYVPAPYSTRIQIHFQLVLVSNRAAFWFGFFFYSSWASCLMCSHSIFPISLWCMIDAYMVCHGDSFSVLRSLVCVKLMVDFLIIERKTNVDRY